MLYKRIEPIFYYFFTFLCEVQGFLKSDSKIALQVHSDAALISSATPQALEVIFLETLKAAAILIVSQKYDIKHQTSGQVLRGQCSLPISPTHNIIMEEIYLME